jgi:hypothetical protein
MLAAGVPNTGAHNTVTADVEEAATGSVEVRRSERDSSLLKT